MAYCPNCGKRTTGIQHFCASCGAAQPVITDNGRYTHPNYQQGYNYEHFTTENKGLAIISYIGFLSIVSYFAAPKTSQYARFHAVQGLNLFLLECILSLTNSIFRGMFFWAWPVKSIVSGCAGLMGVGLLILAILGIISASRGEMKQLPVVSSIKIVKQ